MTPTGTAILDHLRQVEAERAARAADTSLARRVQAVKAYQQARFSKTYGDLLRDARYAAAARYFLDELYGPHDFAQRDAQFIRIVPALVKLFPEEIVQTVAALAALHALSETLDTEMARHAPDAPGPLDRASYARAWQCTGRPEDRESQIRLTLDVGRALDRYTRNPVLRHSLRLMRGPARAAGMRELQAFLERGFDTFGAMRGAQEFLQIIAERERQLARRLFEIDLVARNSAFDGDAAVDDDADPLGELP